MFRLYAGDRLLSSPASDTYRSFGDMLTVEDNAIDKLTFSILRSHPMADSLRLRTTPIKLMDDDKVLFDGRIISMTATATSIDIICESRLAYLRDSVMHPFGWTGTADGLLALFLQRHNAEMLAEQDFGIAASEGSTIVSGDIREESESAQTVWDAIQNHLIKPYGGHLITNGQKLSWLADLPDTNTQQIRFGDNLIDMSKLLDASAIVNRIYPMGKKTSTDIKTVTGGIYAARTQIPEGYVQDNASAQAFGIVAQVVVYEDVTNVETLRAKAKADLKASLTSAITIEATALDLSLEGRHDRLHLGPVRVIHAGLGIDEMLPITKITYNLKEPDKTRITAGKTRKSLTDRI